MEFKITVSKRIAQTTSAESLICGNDGDTLTVTFDDEWTNISAKTARLVWIKDGEYTYIDVPFTGTSCPLPAVIQAKMLFVGFFAGDSTENTLKTSTPAQIPCISSILDISAKVFTPDVYRNILDIIANKVDKVEGKGLSTNDYTNDDKQLVSAVPDEIDTLKGDLNKKVGDTSVFSPSVNFEICFYSNTDGVALKSTSSTMWKSALVDVSDFAGKEITVTVYHDRLRPCFAVDSELHILDTYSTTSGNYAIPRTYTIPITNETKYIIVQTYNDDNLIPTIEGLDVDLTTVVCKNENRIYGIEGRIDEAENSIRDKMTYISSTNHLNPDNIQVDKNFSYNASTGKFSIFSSTGKGNTGYIRVPNYAKYVSFQYEDKQYVINRAIAFDKVGNVIDYNAAVGAYYTIISGTDTILLNIPSLENLLSETARIVFTKDVIPFEPFKLSNLSDLNDNYNVINKKLQEHIETSNSKFEAIDDCVRKIDGDCDRYICTAQPGIDFEEKDESGNKKWTGLSLINKVYSLYDGLVEAYPDYVSKRETPIAMINDPDTGDTYPIYVYELKPIGFGIGLGVSAPKYDNYPTIIYTSGTHGGEGTSIIDGFSFFRDLCSKWQVNKILQDLRFGVKFMVIPIVNPYGVAHSSRKNENGVDLNRNFTPGWRGDITDPTDKNYPGPTPASEVSTQAIEKLIDETPHIFGIDHHIYGSCFGSNPICVAYTVSNQRESSLVYAFAEWVSAQVMKKLPSYTSTDSYKIDKHIPYKIAIGDGDGSGYLYAKFNRGLLLETMTKWGHSESESETKDNERETEKSSHQFNVENLATMMHTAWVVHNNL